MASKQLPKCLLFVFIVMALNSCDDAVLSWNLSRKNDIDTLQNINGNDPNIPVASFLASNKSVPVGSTITFINTSSKNPSSTYWNFQDGLPLVSTKSSPTVVYNRVGRFDVKLKVENSYGSDSITKLGYVESYYYKSFNNGQWDGWSNNGWEFSSSPTCKGCIYAWQNSSGSAISMSISKEFNNVLPNSNLEFYYYIYSPGGTLKIKVNGVELWSADGYGSGRPAIKMPPLTDFTLTFDAEIRETQTIYINDIMIRP